MQKRVIAAIIVILVIAAGILTFVNRSGSEERPGLVITAGGKETLVAWEDVEAADPTLVPYFYYDWYLQRLASGEAMPDEFTPPEKTVIRDIWIDSDEDADI